VTKNLLLGAVGNRIYRLRQGRGWSRRELAERADLSARFLAQVEAGEGNPSLLSLAQIADALETTPASLLEAPPRGGMIALLGLRGAGKSTIGAALALRLGVSFVELDARVEELAGLSLGEIFELHGEEYYRRCEREALESVFTLEPRAVLATGGGLVTHAETFALLKRRATTVWLQATPDEHWDRVVAQGDHRPMANDPLAKTRLRELLLQRSGLYRTADHILETSGHTVDQLVEQLQGLLAARS
jgi:XRE family aerobic/anaerobic benzoate catabolism transcriptional regulator